MNITLIIIAIIVLYVIYSFRKLSFRNPIDGIYFGGTIGFRIGKSYEKCFKELKHIKANIISNDFETGCYPAGQDPFDELPLSRYIRFNRDTYNHIKEVSLCFKKRKLDSILIYIDYNELGIDSMFSAVSTRISVILKERPKVKSNDFCKWGSLGTFVSLTKEDNQIYVCVYME